MDGETTEPCGESSEHSSDSQCHRSEDRTLTHVKKTNAGFTSPRNLSQGPRLHQGISNSGKHRERFGSPGRCWSHQSPLLVGNSPPISRCPSFLPSSLPTTSPVPHHRRVGIDRLMEGVSPDTTSRGHKLFSGNDIRKLGTRGFPAFPSEEKLFVFSVWTHISTGRV